MRGTSLLRLALRALALVIVLVSTTACFTTTQTPDNRMREKRRYLDIPWRTDVAQAFVEARAQNKPVLLIGASGPVDGNTCIGAHRLREDALSHPDVVALIQEELIPVWLDTREHAWPELKAISADEWGLLLDDERKIGNPFYANFFVRSYIITPDERTVLNLGHGLTRRYTPEPDLYQSMITDSLERFRNDDLGRQSWWRFLML
jgi:hypothetical protein